MSNRNYDEPDYKLDGDSLIQLDDGNILSYHYRKSYEYTLKIYDQKEFKVILSIDLEKIIEQNNIVYKYNKDNKDEDEYEYDYEDERPLTSRQSNDLSVIQLKNKSILVGLYHYLIEIKLNEKSFESKMVFKDKAIILNINELPDGRIILITNKAILVLNNFILKDKYIIKDNWRIVPLSLKGRYYYGKFEQHFFSTILPDQRIILRSFSTELDYHGGCATHPPSEFTLSKVIFLTKNFEEIKTTEEFRSDCRDLVFENLIIIQVYDDIYLYDIKTLENIKKMQIQGIFSYFEKYNENEIIAYSKYEKENDLLIFRIEGNDIIKSCEIKNKFNFKEVRGGGGYAIIEYNNKILFVLKDKRIILLCHDVAFLLNLGLK